MKRRLLEPFRIGKMALRNRIVMPPMVTQYAGEKGQVTERIKNYYGARARGGAGLIIVEATYVRQDGQPFANQLGISDDKLIPGLTELAQAIKRHGARAAVQLHHGGRLAKSEYTGTQLLAPSPLAAPGREVPRELTTKEIAELVTCFAEAARRARQAGFDGVEIHGAHGYLIHQFLSRSSNKRRDSYGGDLSNRARFLIQVIRAVREAVGNDYPVWLRISGKEYGVEEGTTLEESQEIARMAQEASVEAIHVSASGPLAPNNLTMPKFVPAVLLELAEGVKKAVSIPVITVGKVTPEAAEKILAEGKADLIAMGRALLADPELPNKVAAEKLEDINPCINCYACRDDLQLNKLGIGCSVNAALGREAESEIIPTKKPRKVLVIGGGPAGMEAARVTALRGHRVALWEKEPRLGGQLIQAATPPYKDSIAPLTEYFKTQLKKLNVSVRLGKVATAAEVGEFKPDVVVLATGVSPFTPNIPGLDKAQAVQAGDVLEGKAKVGNKVAIIGGEMVGCETAEFLADRGKQITVMRRGQEMAQGIGPSLRTFFLSRLKEKGVTLLPGVNYNEVTAKGVVITTREGKKKTVEADSIVLAAGARPDNRLQAELEGKVPEIHLIGDCREPRLIRDAITEGFRTARQI